MGYYNTFVVKLWCDGHGEIVRGRIQHVSSQEHAYFSNLKSMTDFLTNHLSLPHNNFIIQEETRDRLPLLSESMGDISQDERVFPE